MNSIPDEQASRVIALIQKLLPIPERRPRAMEDGMAGFLAEAASLDPIVSVPAERRHSEWKSIFSRKAPLKMSTIATVLAIFTMLFGGTSATVYAAQGSLPDQALYGVKLASEDVRADLTTNNQSRMNLMMTYAGRRLQEAQQLAAQGKSIPATVWERMDGQYYTALRMAAGLNDAQLRQQLPRMHDWMTANLATLAQLSNDPRYHDDVSRVQATYQNYLQLVSGGMMDPLAFRQYMSMHQDPGGWQNPYGWQTPAPSGSVTPAPTNWPGTPPSGSVTPWPTYGSNNQQQNNCQMWNNCDWHHNDDGGHHDHGGWGH